MHHQVLFITNSTPKSISISSFLFINLLFSLLQLSYTQGNEGLLQCFEAFKCGNLTDLVFPFWNGDSPQLCRQQGFELTGCEVDDQPPIINIDGNDFLLIFVNRTTYAMTIARKDLSDDICPSSHSNITLGNPLLHFSSTNQNLTFFYDCELPSTSPSLPPVSAQFQCGQGSSSSPSFYVDDSERALYEDFQRSCGGGDRIQVQVNRRVYEQLTSELSGNLGPRERWNMGFDVVYDLPKIFCDRCNSQDSLCADLSTPDYPICKRSGSSFNLTTKLIIGFVGGASGVVLVTCIFLCFRRKGLCIRTTSFLSKFTDKDQDIEAFLRNNGSLAPKRYSYSEIKKMTNSFRDKIGKGGYGSVFKGKLPESNHLVAVKLLNTSKGNGQEFINEVASISRTSHVNIVTLLGFCLEGGKRALIYEFMPNGSLEKFIYEQMKDLQRLTVEDLYRIAIGIARGLEYLHLGCNIRILHFDIKPHNILLDDKFSPKISDFGLAKLCCRTDSIVSMLEARGTMGYVAPEVFCRNIGSVSHKSDVYSYGMMILEMAGGRKNLDVGVQQTSEIYFPHWIYRHLEQDDIEPELLGLMSKDETEIARKMIVVGLWCIQTNPKDRPSISEVKEMLESKEALQIPPKP